MKNLLYRTKSKFSGQNFGEILQQKNADYD
jgi:hypothetical protein